MALNAAQIEEVAVELKRFSTELNLSDGQKEQLKTAMTQAREKLEQYRQEHPGVTKEQIAEKIAANRTSIRERVVAFLTPEQLKKWDASAANLKDSIGQKSASAS
jgi:predicted HTH transcriptional regulator